MLDYLMALGSRQRIEKRKLQIKKTKTLGEIAKLLEGELIGDPKITIVGVGQAKDAGQGQITLACDKRYFKLALASSAAAVIVSEQTKEEALPKSIIKVKNPSLAWAKTLELFAPKRKTKPGIHPTAVIEEGVEVCEGTEIAAHSFVGKGAKIGQGVIIYPLVYVGEGVEIGDNSIIYPHVSLREGVVIGKKVIIHSGSVIGSDGFGYAEDDGRPVKIPQQGTVIVGDEVEIGANVTIDRATIGATIIGARTKIDNLVQIAHNVTIGENCLIVSQVGISGSVQIEDNVTLAGQAGVADHIKIGKGTIVAAKSGVIKNIGPNQIVSGFPARPHSKEKRVEALRMRLPELLKRIKKLEKDVVSYEL